MDPLIESEIIDRIILLEQRISQLEILLENYTLHRLDTELAVKGFR
jgi:hypothetical protein